MIKRLHGAGSVQVFIDDVPISGVLFDGVPIPEPNTGMAVLKYHVVSEDEGQKIVDKAIYDKKDGRHEYKVILDNDLTWVYDGIVSSHETNIKSELVETVSIMLYGKFKYSRNFSSEPLVIERTFD